MSRLRLALSLFVLALTLGVGPPLASEPIEAGPPTAWMGMASGNDMLWVPGFARHKLSHFDFDRLEQEIHVDADAIRMVPQTDADAWIGSLVERHKRHHKYHKHHEKRSKSQEYYVELDELSHDVIADHLAARIASARASGSIDPSAPALSLTKVRVHLKVRPDKEIFSVYGEVHFRVEIDGDRRHHRRGLYLFGLRGEMQEAMPPEPEGPIRVLLLGDNHSEPFVEAALLDAGYEVTTLARYADWDGVTPDVADFDVAIYLDAHELAGGLTPAGDAAMAAFVANGGGLIRSEWAVWAFWAGQGSPQTDALLPLTYAGLVRCGTTWVVGMSDHPLVAGLPASWMDSACFSLSSPIASATVVVETNDGWPLVTFRTDTGGTVVHINHTLTYPGGASVDANALRLFVNAVAFASGR